MFDFQNIYHTGMPVEDIQQAAAQLSADLNMEFAPIRTFDPLPFWTPEKGLHELKVSATYSRQGPQLLELVQGPKGSFYDPELAPDCRHIGVWVPDLPAEVARLTERGWVVIGAGDSPENGYGILAYLTAPTGGLVVELVTEDLKPVIAEWLVADE